MLLLHAAAACQDPAMLLLHAAVACCCCMRMLLLMLPVLLEYTTSLSQVVRLCEECWRVMPAACSDAGYQRSTCQLEL